MSSLVFALALCELVVYRGVNISLVGESKLSCEVNSSEGCSSGHQPQGFNMDELLDLREIDQLVAWGGKFLRTASTKPDIMKLLLGLGYSEAEHREGWELYLKMLGYMGATATTAPISASTTEQLQALTKIDRFDEPAFRRAKAALIRLHPEQHDYMFSDGLSPKTGAESMGSVQTFLDRYAALRDGTDAKRADKRDADQAAAKTLELRNIVNLEIEQQLRQLIEIVKRPAPLPVPIVATASEEALQESAKAFQSWLHDWRTTASAGITRRDYRIMLGISRRRATPDAPEPPAPEPLAVHA